MAYEKTKSSIKGANIMPIITKPSEHFDAKIYAGNGGASSGTTQNITTSFYPDLTWVKGRNEQYYHRLTSTGLTQPNYLCTNATDPEGSGNDQISALASTYFQVKAAGAGGTNQSGINYVGWVWKAGSGSAVTNTSGSISSQVSANPTAGFSIVTYTGTGSSGTIGHGCQVNGISKAPSMIIYKRRTGGSDSWIVYHASAGAANSLTLNNTNVVYSGGGTYYWGGTAPTPSVFSVATDSAVNTGSSTYVAYCFAEVDGYSKFGSYTGTGAAETNGPFIYCGFRPALIIAKVDANGYNWAMMDIERPGYNSISYRIMADAANDETTVGDPQLDFLSNGFKLRAGNANYAGTVYYMAFAEAPFKYSSAR